MSIQTFAYKVISESSGGADFNIVRARFGDGYSQSTARGINPVVKKFSVVFLGTNAECQQVIDFLEANAGKLFNWKPALRPSSTFFCDGWRMEDLQGGMFKIRAEFEESAAP